jgi:hypothetical protein
MTISQLNNKLTTQLKAFIKKENLYDTGALYKSVKFKSVYKDFELGIKLDSVDYIKYLEKGDFLSKFFELAATKETIQEFYVSQIEKDL